MFKNISTVKLIGILVGLVAIYFVMDYFGKSSRSKDYKSVLVELDTSKVSKIVFTKPGSFLTLDKEGVNWNVALKNGKKVEALDKAVQSAIESLEGIKPSRMVTKKRENWKDYQVDSAGTRVEVYEGSKKALDLVIGRFNMEGHRQFYTYVRPYEDNEVYAAMNFMSMTLPTSVESYRDQTILKFEMDSVSAVHITYASDSAFSLTKAEGGAWTVDMSQPTDSAEVEVWIRSLSNLRNAQFNDEISIGQLGSPGYTLKVEGAGINDVEVKGYYVNGKWVYQSSLNGHALFSAGNLDEKLLVGRASFMQKTFEIGANSINK